MVGRTAYRLGAFAGVWFLVAVAVNGCSSSPKKHSVAQPDSAQMQLPSTTTATPQAEGTESFGEVTGYDAQALLEHRAPYVGDNSKVVGLIDLLPLPGGMSRESVELQTSAEPYGVTIQYEINQETGITVDVENGDPFTLEQWFYRHAAILLSLIGNADYIHFKVDNARTINGDQDHYVYRLDRNDIETVYGDIRGLADDELAFGDYVDKIKRLGSIDLSPPKVLQPDSDGKYLLSRKEVRMPDGDILFINLEMIDGEHVTQEEAGGPGGGTYADNYRGSYRLRVVDSNGKSVSDTALGGEHNFGGAFELAMADYNNDGNPDFTIGQFSNSNGAVYEIYSLNERGQIERLNTNRELYVADHSPSILLDQIDAESFSIRSYMPDRGHGHQTFRWDGTLFAATKPDPSQ